MKIVLYFLFQMTLLIGNESASYAEKRIKKEYVPQKIIDYIEKQYPRAKKEKYYVDTQKDATYYEVELIDKKEKLSLTFLPDGSLYELEKEVSFKSLPAQVQQNILDYLNSNYTRYKIFTVEFVNPHLRIEYELNIKARDKNGIKFYEMHFSETGALLHMDEIIVKPIQTLF